MDAPLLSIARGIDTLRGSDFAGWGRVTARGFILLSGRKFPRARSVKSRRKGDASFQHVRLGGSHALNSGVFARLPPQHVEARLLEHRGKWSPLLLLLRYRHCNRARRAISSGSFGNPGWIRHRYGGRSGLPRRESLLGTDLPPWGQQSTQPAKGPGRSLQRRRLPSNSCHGLQLTRLRLQVAAEPAKHSPRSAASSKLSGMPGGRGIPVRSRRSLSV